MISAAATMVTVHPRRQALVRPWPAALALLVTALLAASPGALAGTTEHLSYGGGNHRHFFNATETRLGVDSVSRLVVKWAFPTNAIVTGQAIVALVDVPGEGEIQVVFIQSWDFNMYALRLSDGSEIWSFDTEVGDGVSYPNAGSVHVEELAGVDNIFFGAGQNVYRLDAATGAEVWRFQAGTGCADPPGLCAYDGERNEVLVSPLVVDGKLIFGMDSNDSETGKGGAYALDVATGYLEWFFDLESGQTCLPDPGDNVTNFDGYHSETELGLPAGFFATRAGCDFDRTTTGCGNVWSSPAVDPGRQLTYWASSNCDTDFDAGTPRPEPPMPPYDAAIFALDYDGVPAWRWRPRETDNADLAFGACPQLFTIDFGGGLREVVGIGNKDGSYYVIDRDGVNEVSAVAWNDVDPSALPYWTADLIPGGAAGGIIGTPAINEAAGVIYIATAPGSDPLAPQQPTLRAVGIDDGSVIWDNSAETDFAGVADSTFSPVLATDELVMIGSTAGASIRIYDAATGTKLAAIPVGFTISSGATVVDGTILVGGGTGERSDNPGSIANITSMIPQDLTALCALGEVECPIPLLGKKLSMKDKASDSSKRKISYLAKDPENLIAPDPGSDTDPTVNGATVTVSNPTTAETDTYSLPASGWKGLGNPEGAKGYKYKDADLVNGPCKTAQVKSGKIIKVGCSGAGIAYSLDEASQTSVAVTVRTGPAGEWQYCSTFGGDISKDAGAAATGDKGDFKSKDAERPPTCP